MHEEEEELEVEAEAEEGDNWWAAASNNKVDGGAWAQELRRLLCCRAIRKETSPNGAIIQPASQPAARDQFLLQR